MVDHAVRATSHRFTDTFQGAKDARPNTNTLNGFSRSSIALTVAANAEVVFTTNYTAAEGFANAPLSNNPDWVGGSNVAIRPGTTGFAINGQIASDQPTYNVHGALGSSSASAFQVGDRISINTYIQFDLPGPNFAQEIARFGFSSATTSSDLEQGFGVVWDEGSMQNPADSGVVRFFPDFNDYVFVDDTLTANNDNSLFIFGGAAGLDVNNVQGNGVDIRSNMFDVSYTVENTGTDQWAAVEFSVVNLSRINSNPFSYDFGLRLPQTFTFAGSDAFFGQRLVVRGQNSENAIARSEYLTYEFTPAIPVPEPSSLFLALAMSAGGFALQRRRTLR